MSVYPLEPSIGYRERLDVFLCAFPAPARVWDGIKLPYAERQTKVSTSPPARIGKALCPVTGRQGSPRPRAGVPPRHAPPATTSPPTTRRGRHQAPHSRAGVLRGPRSPPARRPLPDYVVPLPAARVLRASIAAAMLALESLPALEAHLRSRELCFRVPGSSLNEWRGDLQVSVWVRRFLLWDSSRGEGCRSEHRSAGAWWLGRLTQGGAGACPAGPGVSQTLDTVSGITMPRAVNVVPDCHSPVKLILLLSLLYPRRSRLGITPTLLVHILFKRRRLGYDPASPVLSTYARELRTGRQKHL